MILVIILLMLIELNCSDIAFLLNIISTLCFSEQKTEINTFKLQNKILICIPVLCSLMLQTRSKELSTFHFNANKA